MYGKIFASLYQGTLRGNAHAILVFTNMIACSDRLGNVDKHPRAIADEVGLTVDEVRAAIAFLSAPDPESRTPLDEGRRLLPLEPGRSWGWRITTHAKYREMRDEESRREQWRAYKDKVRKGQMPSTPCPQVSTLNVDSPQCPQSPPQSTHADADADADANTDSKAAAAAPPSREHAATASSDPMDQAFQAVEKYNPPPRRPIPPASFADWRIMVGKRCFVGVDERADWLAMFQAEGWDEMTKGYEHLAKKHPEPAKIFLSAFQEIR